MSAIVSEVVLCAAGGLLLGLFAGVVRSFL